MVVAIVLQLLFLIYLSLPAYATVYTYDDLDRLISATYDSGETVTYTYDAAGNISGIVTKIPSTQPGTGSTGGGGSGGGGGGGGVTSNAPAAPDVKVVAVTATSVTLHLKSSANIAGFNVYVNDSLNPANPSLIVALNNEAQYVLEGLQPDTVYTLAVEAVGTDGTRSPKATVAIKTLASQGVDQQDKMRPITFQDVPPDYWAHNDICEMARQDFVRGVGKGLFAPDRTITRAEFTAILVRILKLEQQESMPFNDVSRGAWYHSSVASAYAAGIIHGISPVEFGPELPITREQMAAMIANVLAYKGKDADSMDYLIVLKRFDDWQKISEWARISVARITEKGIAKGRPALNGKLIFDPFSGATRAEATVMLKRLLQVL